MSITKNGLVVDDLGRETQFILVTHQIPGTTKLIFERRLYDYALGFTSFSGRGGWRGTSEPITIYRVASLSEAQRDDLIKLLLDETSMTDLYVVLPGGEAVGYSLPSLPSSLTPRDGFAMTARGGGRPDPLPVEETGQEPLHGVRDTGWPHTATDHP